MESLVVCYHRKRRTESQGRASGCLVMMAGIGSHVRVEVHLVREVGTGSQMWAGGCLMREAGIESQVKLGGHLMREEGTGSQVGVGSRLVREEEIRSHVRKGSVGNPLEVGWCHAREGVDENRMKAAQNPLKASGSQTKIGRHHWRGGVSRVRGLAQPSPSPAGRSLPHTAPDTHRHKMLDIR